MRRISQDQVAGLMNVHKAVQLKEIITPSGMIFPLSPLVRIVLDKKKPKIRKEHQIIYQQGSHYGTVGDKCDSINHLELFDLSAKGMIKLS